VAQGGAEYDALIQRGNAQLQARTPDQALATGEQAIKMDATRWEGYALAGGALMNLKRYDEAIDTLSKSIDHAPAAKQPGLRDLIKQCVLAQSGVAAPTGPAAAPQPAVTTQAEIVLWKSIENSTNPADFQSYLSQYPNGAFVVLSKRHLADVQTKADQQQQDLFAKSTWTDPSTGLMWTAATEKDKKGHMQLRLLSFAGATEYCAKLMLGQHSDWRLPTIEEAVTLKKPSHDDLKRITGAPNSIFNLWTDTPGRKGRTHQVRFIQGGGDVTEEWGDAGTPEVFCVRSSK
jgi:tetratricopeptide (TPR) repeat protein